MNSTRNLLVLLATSLATLPQHAFADSMWGEFEALDTESVPLPGEEEDIFAGRVKLGYLSASGNSETKNANGDALLGWELPKWRHRLAATAIYAEDEEATTAERYRVGYKADRKLDERNYIFGTASWEQDEFSGYEERLTEAVGYGRRVLETPRHILDLEIGAGARQSEFVDGTELDETIARLFGDYLWKFGANSEFSQELTVETGSENTYTESVTSVTSQLLGELDLVLSYTIKRNSDVPEGVEKTDAYTSVNVQYSF